MSLGVNIGFILHWAWPKITTQGTVGASSGWHAGPMKQRLGLTSAQARHLESERRKVLAQTRPLQDALRQKRRELLLLLKNKNQDVDDSGLDATLAEIARLQAAIEKAFILHSLKVRGFFSPGQLRKYEGFLEQGLCPAMMSAADCLPGKMGGRRMDGAGCGRAAEKAK
jgi:hypothetical protein